MKTYNPALLLALLLVITFNSPPGANCMTLRECVVSAIANSPGLSSERHLINADEADVTKRKATTLPYLSSQLQGYMVNGTPVTPWVPSGVFQPENGIGRRGAHWAPIGIESVGVAYPLLYQGSILGLNDPPVVMAARAQMSMEQLIEVLREQKVVFDVVSGYIHAVSYRQQAAIYDRMVELSQDELEVVEQQEQIGHKLPQDVLVLQAALLAVESARATVRENAGNCANDLATMVGGQDSGVDTGLQIDNVLPALSPLPPLRQFLDQVMPGHPALLVDNAKGELARQQLRVDEANRWPTASFATTFGGAQDLEYFSGSATHLRPTAFESYLTLTIPLFDFGGHEAAVHESRENLLAEQTNLRQADLDIRSSITQEYGEVLQNTALLFNLQSTLVKDSASLELVKAQLAEDKADRLAVLSAEAATLQDTLAIRIAEMSERLRYAELQNLSAGKWHWAP